MNAGLPFPLALGLTPMGERAPTGKVDSKEGGEGDFTGVLKGLLEEKKAQGETQVEEMQLLGLWQELMLQEVQSLSIDKSALGQNLLPEASPGLSQHGAKILSSLELLPIPQEWAFEVPQQEGQGLDPKLGVLPATAENLLNAPLEGEESLSLAPKGLQKAFHIAGFKSDAPVEGKGAGEVISQAALDSKVELKAESQSITSGLPSGSTEKLGEQQNQELMLNHQNFTWGDVGEKNTGLVSSSPRSFLPQNVQEVFDQLIQFSKITVQEGKSQVEIQLKPEYLGKVQLQLTLEEGILTAKFLVENQAVGRMLESNLTDLRQSLQEQGLKFEQVQVEVGTGGFAQEQEKEFKQSRSFGANLAAQRQPEAEDATEKRPGESGINLLA